MNKIIYFSKVWFHFLVRFLIHVQERNKYLWNNLLIITSLILQRNTKKNAVQSDY